MWSAAFTIVGPEYLSIVSAEAQRPRIFLKTALKTVYFRFVVFFILGALCVGIVVPWNDQIPRPIWTEERRLRAPPGRRT